MSRNLSAAMVTGPGSLTSNQIRPAFFVDITFKSLTEHVWNGVGSFVWNGNTYTGVGSLGKIGSVGEGTTVNAEGTSIGLSGIDPVLLSECMTDIQIGAPCTIWLGLLDPYGNVIGTPYPLFVGTVDQPQLELSVEELAITLKLENRLVNLQRATNRRYTAADQNLYYSGDTFFNWVEILNDQALLWAP